MVDYLSWNLLFQKSYSASGRNEQAWADRRYRAGIHHRVLRRQMGCATQGATIYYTTEEGCFACIGEKKSGNLTLSFLVVTL